MIENSIESLFDSINSSNEYKEYLEITKILNDNKEIKLLIDDIKKLQKEATKFEFENDDKYREIDSLIEEKTKKLNEIPEYKEYLSKLKVFNNSLLASSSLLEEYIDSKVSI